MPLGSPFDIWRCQNVTSKEELFCHILIQMADFLLTRVKSGILGQTAKLGQPPCLFHSSIIDIKNKITKQTVKILMRRLIRSRLIWISTVCKGVSEFI